MGKQRTGAPRGRHLCIFNARSQCGQQGCALDALLWVSYPINPGDRLAIHTSADDFQHVPTQTNEFFTSLAPASQDSAITPSEPFTPPHWRCLEVSRVSTVSNLRYNSCPAIQHCHYSVPRFQRRLHAFLSPVTTRSKSGIICGLNAPIAAVTEAGRPPAHIMQDKRGKYKESPIHRFFILLWVGTEADTHKDPLQRGVIYHTVEIHGRQMTLELTAPALTCSVLKGGCN